MEFITLPSGRRVIRAGGAVYQETSLDADHLVRDFAAARWSQDIGGDGETEMPSVAPVLLVVARANMFFAQDQGDPLLVARNDGLARCVDGHLFAVPMERMRNFASLPVGREATQDEITAAAAAMSERVLRTRQAAKLRAEGEQVSPISIREDDEGRALLVSTLADGRERTWKRFGWRSAAEDHLSDPKNRAALESEHARASLAAGKMQDHIDALRRARRDDARE